MSKPKGVWLQTTELRDIQEATVVSSASDKAPAARRRHQEQRGVPVLLCALGVCCCILVGLVSLHVLSARADMPDERLAAEVPAEASGAIVAVIAEPDIMAEDLPILPHGDDPVAPEPEPEPDSEQVTEPEPVPAVANAVPAPPKPDDTDRQVLASRGAESGNVALPVEESEPGTITVGGATYSYSSKLSVSSTAYTWTGNTTATGTWPAKGTVAVDPSIIPLGTKVYVEGYGFATAADTGGAIKGSIIDVYFSSRDECIKWGRKHGVAVYILE